MRTFIFHCDANGFQTRIVAEDSYNANEALRIEYPEYHRMFELKKVRDWLSLRIEKQFTVHAEQ